MGICRILSVENKHMANNIDLDLYALLDEDKMYLLAFRDR